MYIDLFSSRFETPPALATMPPRRSVRQHNHASTTDTSGAEEPQTRPLSLRVSRASRTPRQAADRQQRATSFSRIVNLDVEIDVTPVNNNSRKRKSVRRAQIEELDEEQSGVSEVGEQIFRSRDAPRSSRAHNGLDQGRDITPRASSDRGKRRRVSARPSLGVIPFAKRIDIIAELARDCLTKLLSADQAVRSDEGSKAWAVLQSIRHQYLFKPPAPIFTDYRDVITLLPENTQYDALETSASLDLSNLCNFIWTILHPDEAAFKAVDEVADDSTPRAGRKAGEDEEKYRVQRRNAFLLLAWKKFWFVAISRDMRGDVSAIKLWLDFATMIVRSWQCPTISPSSASDSSLPPISDETLQTLFSPTALSRYGQWQSTDDASDTDAQDNPNPQSEQGTVTKRWQALLRRRKRDLDEKKEEVLDRQFVWSKFSGEVCAFIRIEMDEGQSLSPTIAGRKKGESSRTGPSRQHGEYEDEDEEDMITAESALESGMEDEDDVGLDQFGTFAREMEEEDAKAEREGRKPTVSTASPTKRPTKLRSKESGGNLADFERSAEQLEQEQQAGQVTGSEGSESDRHIDDEDGGEDEDMEDDVMPSTQEMVGPRRKAGVSDKVPSRPVETVEEEEEEESEIDDVLPSSQEMELLERSAGTGEKSALLESAMSKSPTPARGSQRADTTEPEVEEDDEEEDEGDDEMGINDVLPSTQEMGGPRRSAKESRTSSSQHPKTRPLPDIEDEDEDEDEDDEDMGTDDVLPSTQEMGGIGRRLAGKGSSAIPVKSPRTMSGGLARQRRQAVPEQEADEEEAGIEDVLPSTQEMGGSSRTRRSPQRRNAKPSRPEPIEEEAEERVESQWTTKDGPPLSQNKRFFGRKPTPESSRPKFSFKDRQEDAVQIDFETQSTPTAAQRPKKNQGSQKKRKRSQAKPTQEFVPTPGVFSSSAEEDEVLENIGLGGDAEVSPGAMASGSRSDEEDEDDSEEEQPRGYTSSQKGKGREIQPTPSLPVVRAPSYRHEDHNDFVPPDNNYPDDYNGDYQGNYEPEQSDVEDEDVKPVIEEEPKRRRSKPQQEDGKRGREVGQGGEEEGGEEDDEDYARPGERPLAIPASQKRLSTSGSHHRQRSSAAQQSTSNDRPRASRRGNEYIPPTASDEEEDRQLLLNKRRAGSSSPHRAQQRGSSNAEPGPSRRQASRTLSVGSASSDRSDDSQPRPKRRVARRAKRQARSGSESGSDDSDSSFDQYMVDSDGEPLETDERFPTPPADGNIMFGSVLHEKIEGINSHYIYRRLSGYRRWTERESLLLYRTVQKTSLSVQNPCRMAWYLHGEFGLYSHELEMFTPMNMKDKMKDIAKLRRREKLPVVGRARFFLPYDDKRRAAFFREKGEWIEDDNAVRRTNVRRAHRNRGSQARRDRREHELADNQRRLEARRQDDEQKHEEEEAEEEGRGEASAVAGGSGGNTQDGNRRSSQARKRARVTDTQNNEEEDEEDDDDEEREEEERKKREADEIDRQIEKEKKKAKLIAAEKARLLKAQKLAKMKQKNAEKLAEVERLTQQAAEAEDMEEEEGEAGPASPPAAAAAQEEEDDEEEPPQPVVNAGEGAGAGAGAAATAAEEPNHGSDNDDDNDDRGGSPQPAPDVDNVASGGKRKRVQQSRKAPPSESSHESNGENDASATSPLPQRESAEPVKRKPGRPRKTPITTKALTPTPPPSSPGSGSGSGSGSDSLEVPKQKAKVRATGPARRVTRSTASQTAVTHAKAVKPPGYRMKRSAPQAEDAPESTGQHRKSDVKKSKKQPEVSGDDDDNVGEQEAGDKNVDSDKEGIANDPNVAATENQLPSGSPSKSSPHPPPPPAQSRPSRHMMRRLGAGPAVPNPPISDPDPNGAGSGGENGSSGGSDASGGEEDEEKDSDKAEVPNTTEEPGAGDTEEGEDVDEEEGEEEDESGSEDSKAAAAREAKEEARKAMIQRRIAGGGGTSKR